jgi:hypothetical protein
MALSRRELLARGSALPAAPGVTGSGRDGFDN